VLVAHDWGGAIAMGWAVEHADRVAGLVLSNTGIAVPAGRRAPGLIRLAASRGMLATVCRRTSVFVRGTAWLSRGRTPAWFREALMAPYRRAVDRSAIEGFVADVPFDDAHPSAADLAAVADRLPGLDVPVLLGWGGSDPVFDDDFADDLAGRFRHATIHRFPGANHLVPVDEDLAPLVATFLDGLEGAAAPAGSGAAPGQAASAAGFRPVWAGLEARAEDESVAFHDAASGRSVSFQELHELVGRIGGRLRAAGVQPGDRIALLVPPSVELVAVVYACWRVGAVTVIADRGLGLGGLGNAIRSARVSWVLGPRPARAAARTLRWAPRATPLVLEDLVADAVASTNGTTPEAVAEAAAGAAGATPDLGAGPGPDDPIALLFTSGATGPAKGVRYRHHQLAAQRDALAATYSIGPDDRLVAAFAPFALYGPALGIASAVPDVDVTRPGALTAEALDQACAAIEATMVFASPAALANVVATAGDTSGASLAAVRTVMSAGAPVPVGTLRAVARLTPAATLHTPYGMTECLPVADIDLVGIEAALVGDGGGDAAAGLEAGRGVCVGPPVPGCEVRVAPIGFDAGRALDAGLEPGMTGELLVRAPWCSDGYDRRWHTERSARPADAEGRTWHRTGDVGHVDELGRVWVEGRSAHVIHAADGPVTPVPVEVAAESRALVRRAAAVGIGPVGRQQLVVVVEPVEGEPAAGRAGRVVGRVRRRGGGALSLADSELAASVRSAVVAATGHPVAAVCTTEALPVDIRHNAKIDRTAVSAAASTLLAGG
jgi:acyl-CoA synthetase (AMP-forming)/AMP-acid ligase II